MVTTKWYEMEGGGGEGDAGDVGVVAKLMPLLMQVEKSTKGPKTAFRQKWRLSENGRHVQTPRQDYELYSSFERTL